MSKFTKHFDFVFESNELANKMSNIVEWCVDIKVSSTAELEVTSYSDVYIDGVEVSLSIDNEPVPMTAMSENEKKEIIKEANRLADKHAHQWAIDHLNDIAEREYDELMHK
jgi:dTDP-glucose pyrophosphorylase